MCVCESWELGHLEPLSYADQCFVVLHIYASR